MAEVNAAIRPECLLPPPDWQRPTGDEVRALLAIAGLTSARAAAILGMSSGRLIRHWKSGAGRIQYPAWAILCSVAGFGNIWETTGDRNGNQN